MAEADFFLPAVWSLDAANVQAIESSATDPKVRMDSTGLFVTDATGAQLVNLDADGLSIERPDYTPPGTVLPAPAQTVEWKRTDGSVSGLVANVRRVAANENSVYLVSEGAGESSNAVNSRAVSPSGLQLSNLRVGATNLGGTNVSVSALAGLLGNPTGNVTVIDGNGASNFLQLLDSQRIAGRLFQLTNLAMPVGVTALVVYPALPPGFTIIGATVILENPSGHWNYVLHPHPLEIICSNTGVAQTMVNFAYIVWGQ